MCKLALLKNWTVNLFIEDLMLTFKKTNGGMGFTPASLIFYVGISLILGKLPDTVLGGGMGCQAMVGQKPSYQSPVSIPPGIV